MTKLLLLLLLATGCAAVLGIPSEVDEQKPPPFLGDEPPAPATPDASDDG